MSYNEGAHQIYGYAPEEVIGKQNIEIFFPKDFIESAGLQQIIDNLIGKDGFSYEGEKVRKNGDRFPANILFTLTKDNIVNLVGFIEIVEDLTEQKRAKDALQKAHDELEIRVGERTAELAKTNEGLRTEIAEHKQAEEALNKSEKDIRKRVKELEEFYDMAVGRELRMIELKDEIKRLESELKRYKNP
jgi:PAS domain S-box-containing protein